MGNPRQGHMPVAIKWHYILEHDDPSIPAGFRPSEARSRSLNHEPPPLATCPPPTPQGVPLPPPPPSRPPFSSPVPIFKERTNNRAGAGSWKSRCSFSILTSVGNN